MTSRRRFIAIVPVALPVASALLLAACGDKAAPVASAPAPATPPSPVAAPAAPVVAATPAPEATPAAASPAPATAPASPSAAAGAMVDEKDPSAAALGYVAEATRTDKTKYPKYAAEQHCANCALFQGQAGAASGGCPLYPAKQVSAKGWCSAYAKKTMG